MRLPECDILHKYHNTGKIHRGPSGLSLANQSTDRLYFRFTTGFQNQEVLSIVSSGMLECLDSCLDYEW